MAFRQPKSEKLFYSIGEVSEMFGLAPSTIRFWEKEFPTIQPHKNKKGDRFFKQEDIDHLALINHLVKEKGMTLKGAKTRIKESRKEAENNFELVNKLQQVKDYLLEIKNEL